MTNQINQTTVTTGRVRLSYPHLFMPNANKPGEMPKYKVTILIPKTDIVTKQRVDAAINAAIQKGITRKWNGITPVQVKIPVWDGDGCRQDGETFGPECKGHWVLTASSNYRQEIIDLNLKPITDQSAIYSGIYGRVNVDFFPYYNSENSGIGCGLGPVQKLEDGEPLGGRISAATAFGDGFSGYNTQIPSNIQQPVYSSQVPSYTQSQSMYMQQPAFQQSVFAGQPPQIYQPPAYYGQSQQIYQQQPAQFDPITGAAISGSIMGLNNEIPF